MQQVDKKNFQSKMSDEFRPVGNEDDDSDETPFAEKEDVASERDDTLFAESASLDRTAPTAEDWGMWSEDKPIAEQPAPAVAAHIPISSLTDSQVAILKVAMAHLLNDQKLFANGIESLHSSEEILTEVAITDALKSAAQHLVDPSAPHFAGLLDMFKNIRTIIDKSTSGKFSSIKTLLETQPATFAAMATLKNVILFAPSNAALDPVIASKPSVEAIGVVLSRHYVTNTRVNPGNIKKGDVVPVQTAAGVRFFLSKTGSVTSVLDENKMTVALIEKVVHASNGHIAIISAVLPDKPKSIQAKSSNRSVLSLAPGEALTSADFSDDEDDAAPRSIKSASPLASSKKMSAAEMLELIG
jgi:hypothetical protein